MYKIFVKLWLQCIACGRAKVPCGKQDTGSNECQETFWLGVKSPAAKKIMCGDVVSGTYIHKNTQILEYEESSDVPLS